MKGALKVELEKGACEVSPGSVLTKTEVGGYGGEGRAIGVVVFEEAGICLHCAKEKRLSGSVYGQVGRRKCDEGA